jgi:hypothetical protein
MQSPPAPRPPPPPPASPRLRCHPHVRAQLRSYAWVCSFRDVARAQVAAVGARRAARRDRPDDRGTPLGQRTPVTQRTPVIQRPPVMECPPKTSTRQCRKARHAGNAVSFERYTHARTLARSLARSQRDTHVCVCNTGALQFWRSRPAAAARRHAHRERVSRRPLPFVHQPRPRNCSSALNPTVLAGLLAGPRGRGRRGSTGVAGLRSTASC